MNKVLKALSRGAKIYEPMDYVQARRTGKVAALFSCMVGVGALGLMQLTAGEVSAAAGGIYGLPAMSQMERLPLLQPHTQSGGQSSYQRSTNGTVSGNNDWNNFLYTLNFGTEKVMLDQKGPGTVYRIWATGFNPGSDWIKVYFDGETTPRINMPMRDVFSGTKPPFLAPLVADNTKSSGGFTTYLPLPYAKSIRITTSMSNYYNVGYQSYTPGTAVATWTGSEDSSAVRSAWSNIGADPKPDSGNVAVSGSTTLRPGATQTILDTTGSQAVSSIKVSIPNVTPQTNVADNGRAHKGSSQFNMAVDAANTGVILKRRMDYGVADQRAGVYVDGAYVGDWFDGGSDSTFRWRDSKFTIPSSFTAGKSTITVKIQFVSAAVDWNEFTYWAYSQVNNDTVLTDTLDVADGSSESLHGYQINTATWSGLQQLTYPQLTDNGRAHKGTSQFTMAIDPASTDVTLVRRSDYGIPNQTATVTVDGVSAGTWSNPGFDGTNRWRDSSFAIPAALTAGKSNIVVQIQFVSSDNDWNEFAYYTYSSVNGDVNLSDTLDVGTAASEAAHAYSITGQTFSGSLTASYDTADILNNTRIRITWDGESTPSVDAPIGSFFGVGQLGAYTSRSLMAGMDADGQMYIYLPMPFQQRAVVQLVSDRNTPTVGLAYETRYKPYSGDFANTGYLRTKFTATTPAVINKDIPILDIAGSGNLVGVTASYSAAGGPGYLEGDERIYVDDNASPSIYGTGTEDFFDGGWYFDRGPFSRPVASMATSGWLGANHETAANRFFLADSIPFKRRITASIEHGGRNQEVTNAWTLAYYYQKPDVKLSLTDTLDVGNSSSEAAHAYRITTQRWSGSRTYQYEGTADTTNITDNGRAHTGSSQFNIAINPNNDGVVLRRRFDQTIANQQANVYVDNVLVGAWYVAGGNGFHQWRDSDFAIPASFTSGKSKVQVRVQFVSSTNDWNEFRYWAYTIAP